MDIYYKDIREIISSLNSGEITAEDINKNTLEKIGKENKNYTVLNPKALEIAREIDKKEKSERGSLSGIPVAVEDSISTKGILTQNGSKILEDYIPIFDAKVVESLYQEDTVIIGKGRLGEFGIDQGENIYGTAKAVKEGEAVFGISLDTKGDVRFAAEKYNLFGFRPTYGLISRYGVIAHASSLDQIGIIAKSTDDTSFALNALVKEDKRDSASVSIENIDYTGIKDESLKKFKIGIPEQYLKESSKDKEEKLNSLLEKLKELGHRVEYIDIPSFKYSKAVYDIVSSGEFASNTARYDGISYGYRADEYENIEELYKNTRTEGFGLKVKEKILFGNFVIGEGQYEEYYERAQKLRSKIKEEFKDIFNEYDLVINYIDEGATMGANLAGLPSMAIPHRDKEESIGFQIVADKFREEALLNFAYNYEREVLKKRGGK